MLLLLLLLAFGIWFCVFFQSCPRTGDLLYTPPHWILCEKTLDDLTLSLRCLLGHLTSPHHFLMVAEGMSNNTLMRLMKDQAQNIVSMAQAIQQEFETNPDAQPPEVQTQSNGQAEAAQEAEVAVAAADEAKSEQPEAPLFAGSDGEGETEAVLEDIPLLGHPRRSSPMLMLPLSGLPPCLSRG